MVSDYIQAAVLGIVQGLTEFIPVSSSGHLILVREVLGWSDQGLAFDVVLHMATLLAVIIYFWKDWIAMAQAVFTRRQTHEAVGHRRLVGLLAVTTLPAIGAALLFMDFIEGQGRNLWLVSSLLILVGIIFLVVEKVAQPKRDISKLTFFDALSIGLAQAASIFPGISRSGATIITGLYHGLKRETAAKYSFLAAGPIIALAGIDAIWQMIQTPPEGLNWVVVGIGFVVSFVSGLLAIHWLLGFIKRFSLAAFAIYRIVLGVGLIIFELVVR